jgi:hypothetical protein
MKKTLFAIHLLLVGIGCAAFPSAALAQKPVLDSKTGSISTTDAPMLAGTATLLSAWPAEEAGQGAAIDEDHFYAVVNTRIGKYDRATGQRISQWSSPRGGPIIHINSCYANTRQLFCAHSNFPEIPMASSIEIFDTATMTHAGTHSLGLMDEGSLTFFDKIDGGWIAGFTHYDEKGGVGFKKSEYSSVIVFDEAWRRTGGWLIPDSIRSRMAPHGASGGAIGNDGWLYLMGHDLPEIYVVGKPKMGGSLVHITTFGIAAEGQALAFERGSSRRMVAISRPNREVRHFELPAAPQTIDTAVKFVGSQHPAVGEVFRPAE